MLAEVLLIAFVCLVGVSVVWRQYVVLTTATWYATPTAAGMTLSRTGVWYAYVSLALFQFLLLRWYFRIFIWARFLWHVSRIELSLIPTHPDRVGGLGFLANTVYAFVPLALAHGALLAGLIANRIFYLGARLLDFKIEVAVVLAFMLCLVFGPLVVFAAQLAQAKRTGSREYGTLAERYVREFDAKWLRGGAPANEQLVGSGDIQSLADLANSVEVVRTMRLDACDKGGDPLSGRRDARAGRAARAHDDVAGRAAEDAARHPVLMWDALSSDFGNPELAGGDKYYLAYWPWTSSFSGRTPRDRPPKQPRR